MRVVVSWWMDEYIKNSWLTLSFGWLITCSVLNLFFIHFPYFTASLAYPLLDYCGNSECSYKLANLYVIKTNKTSRLNQKNPLKKLEWKMMWSPKVGVENLTLGVIFISKNIHRSLNFRCHVLKVKRDAQLAA